MKILKYIFYRFYSLMVSVGNVDVAQYYSILLITFLLTINIFTCIGFSYVFIGKAIKLSASKLNICLEFIALTSLLYFLLVKDNKHLKIIEYYKNETKQQQKTGMTIAISYIVFSIALMSFTFYLMMNKNRGEL